MKIKKLTFIVLFFFSITISCILTLEFGSRFFIKESNPKNILYFINKENNLKIGPKNLTLKHIKNTGDYNVTVNFNKYGFRDSKDLRNASKKDFFVVGDSMSFGWGVKENERYSNLLEQLTNKKIYNISIPGDLDNYILLLKYAEEKGAKISNLIIGFTMENDFANYDKTFKKTDKKPPISNFFNISKLKRFLTTNSSFYFVLTREVHKRDFLRKFFIKLNLINPNLEHIYYTNFSKKILMSTAKKLQEITSKYKSIVIIIPSRALWYGENKIETNKIHINFLNILKKKNIEYVDLKSYFEKDSDPLKYHFKKDGHWNKSGHKIAAEAVFKKYFKIY